MHKVTDCMVVKSVFRPLTQRNPWENFFTGESRWAGNNLSFARDSFREKMDDVTDHMTVVHTVGRLRTCSDPKPKAANLKLLHRETLVCQIIHCFYGSVTGNECCMARLMIRLCQSWLR